MSGVDVLAWFGDCNGDTPNDRAAREVRDAVAELIEAADGVDATHSPMLNGPVDPKVQQLALDRLRAALARVTGGSDGR